MIFAFSLTIPSKLAIVSVALPHLANEFNTRISLDDFGRVSRSKLAISLDSRVAKKDRGRPRLAKACPEDTVSPGDRTRVTRPPRKSLATACDQGEYERSDRVTTLAAYVIPCQDRAAEPDIELGNVQKQFQCVEWPNTALLDVSVYQAESACQRNPSSPTLPVHNNQNLKWAVSPMSKQLRSNSLRIDEINLTAREMAEKSK